VPARRELVNNSRFRMRWIRFAKPEDNVNFESLHQGYYRILFRQVGDAGTVMLSVEQERYCDLRGQRSKCHWASSHKQTKATLNDLHIHVVKENHEFLWIFWTNHQEETHSQLDSQWTSPKMKVTVDQSKGESRSEPVQRWKSQWTNPKVKVAVQQSKGESHSEPVQRWKSQWTNPHSKRNNPRPG